MIRRVLLVGPYGGKNLGDDLILHQVLVELRRLELEVVVSCSNPDFVAMQFGVETCPLLEYRSWTISSLEVMRTVDAVIIGGGEQLSEPRVINPVWGHLARTAHLCRVARKYGKPVMLWAVGLDKLRSRLSKWLLRQFVFRPGVVACLRDLDSIDRAKSIATETYDGLHIVADPAYALPALVGRQLAPEARLRLGVNDAEKRLLLVPAYDKFVSLHYLDILTRFGKAAQALGYKIYGWTTDLQPGYDDVLIEHPAFSSIPGFSWISREYLPPDDFAAFIGEFDLLVSARMHPIIVAQTQSVPSFVLARSAKMTAMLKRFGLAGSDLEHLSFDQLSDFLNCKASEKSSDEELLEAREASLRSAAIFKREILELH